MEKISTRDAYGAAIAALGGENDRIVVLNADLMSSTRTAAFKKAYPDRCFDFGIAESNMMGFAAGLAKTGLIPFAGTFAVFAAGRAYDQVRMSVCLSGANVKIVAINGGLTAGSDGASHQMLEDIAMMRALPGMTVIAPADAVETQKAVRAIADYDGPVYLRLGRDPSPVCIDPKTPFIIGKAEKLADGSDISLLATGLMVPTALEAAEKLGAEGIHARVYDFHTIKPLDTESLREACRTGYVLTVEDHQAAGGFGGAVDEYICQSMAGQPVRVFNMGVRDRFGQSGSIAELDKAYGLTSEDIAANAKRLLARK